MRSSSSTAQVYQRDPTEPPGWQRVTRFAQGADTTESRAYGRGPMTDPRFHDLTELSRRMTSASTCAS